MVKHCYGWKRIAHLCWLHLRLQFRRPLCTTQPNRSLCGWRSIFRRNLDSSKIQIITVSHFQLAINQFWRPTTEHSLVALMNVISKQYQGIVFVVHTHCEFCFLSQIYCIIDLVYYSIAVCQVLCDYLGIYCFRVPAVATRLKQNPPCDYEFLKFKSPIRSRRSPIRSRSRNWI